MWLIARAFVGLKICRLTCRLTHQRLTWVLTWSSLIFLCSCAINACSSSIFVVSWLYSNSFFFNFSSNRWRSFSKSMIVSCESLMSPSCLRFVLSSSMRTFFSCSKDASSYKTIFLLLKLRQLLRLVKNHRSQPSTASQVSWKIWSAIAA